MSAELRPPLWFSASSVVNFIRICLKVRMERRRCGLPAGG